MRRRRSAVLALALLAATGLALTLRNLFFSGFTLTVGSLQVSARSPTRTFLVAGLAFVLILHLSTTIQRQVDRLTIALARRRRLVVGLGLVVLSAGVLTVAIRYGSFVASAADSYGYVTSAEAMAGLPGIEPEPATLVDAWPDARRALTPLGYVIVGDAAVAPVYPPGFPLLMAAFSTVAGHAALFLVVPFAAVVLVVATYALGRRMHDIWTGLGAALIVAVSPVFLLHASVPMSDVPAAAAWTMAAALSVWPSRAGAVGAGLLAGVALLIRPNLLPMVAPLLLLLLLRPGDTHGRWLRMRTFGTALVPGVFALLYVNEGRYGWALDSGYGAVGVLFSPGYFGANVSRFGSWMLRTETAFPVLGFLLIVPALARRVATAAPQRLATYVLILYVLTCVFCYVFYLPFDTWGFLRFLLPALPALLVLAVMATRALLTFVPRRLGAVAATMVVITVALACWERTLVNSVLMNERSVRRFVDVPRFAATALPQQAIFITRLYSGSMRYYGGRPTVRWDYIASASLDEVIAMMTTRGFAPYIVIEGAEERQLFTEHFAGQRYGELDWSPAAVYDGIERVAIYDPRARDGMQAAPRSIPVSTSRVPLR